MDSTDVQAARERLRARFGNSVRAGGDTGIRLTRRAVVQKTTVGDDRKVSTAIKKMGLSQLPSVDEVVMTKKDGTALQFTRPVVQAVVNANTFVIVGSAKEIQQEEINSSPLESNIDLWNKFQADWKKVKDGYKINNSSSGTAANADDDNDIPLLIENFEEISKIEDVTQDPSKTPSSN